MERQGWRSHTEQITGSVWGPGTPRRILTRLSFLGHCMGTIDCMVYHNRLDIPLYNVLQCDTSHVRGFSFERSKISAASLPPNQKSVTNLRTERLPFRCPDCRLSSKYPNGWTNQKPALVIISILLGYICPFSLEENLSSKNHHWTSSQIVHHWSIWLCVKRDLSYLQVKGYDQISITKLQRY